jgi:DNA/RNA-binding domain of Phe-tRNA-synthetase-like protein
MRFRHSADIWRDYPQLVPGVLFVDGIHPDVTVDSPVARCYETAEARLATASEGEFPEIQAWRRTFSAMGLKPTQYRCAAESLLRRFRKEHTLPRIHPLVDLCNAISLAYATPIAVFDLSHVTDELEVRYASGDENYRTLAGETEHPAGNEVVFADAAGRAHARRWTNRQSAHSVVRETTRTVLIVAEAMHDTASTDVQELVATLSDDLHDAWSVAPKTAILTASAPEFLT